MYKHHSEEDLAMMIGKTKIELVDVNTGKKEVFLDDNLVTNARRDMWDWIINEFGPMTPGVGTVTLNEEFANFFSSGIMLFNDVLTLDADNYYFKDVLNMRSYLVGWANGNYSGSDTYRGTLNLTESKMTGGKVMEIVYDFPTDSANGTIDSVAIVPYLAIDDLSVYGDGDNKYDYMKDTSFGSYSADELISLGTPLLVSTDDQVSWEWNTSTKLVTKKIWNRVDATSDWTILATHDYSALITDANSLIRYDDVNDKLYIWRYDDRILYEISQSSAAINQTYDLSSVISATALDQNARYVGINDDEIFYGDGLTSDNRRVYKYDFVLSSGPTTIDLSSAVNIDIPSSKTKYFHARKGKIIVRLYNLYDTADDHYIWLDAAGTGIEGVATIGDTYSYRHVNNNVPIHVSSSGSMYIRHMMATKNNLGTPVTKLDTQTMKLTYTLTWS